MSKINRHVRRAIRRRQMPMVVTRTTGSYADNGDWEEGVPVNTDAFGVFQQILRFDDDYSHHLAFLEEGERLEFEGVVWTTEELNPGDSETGSPADIIYFPHLDKSFKVLRTRHKHYGSFDRVYVGRI